MKKIFTFWLFWLIFTAFLLTFTVSWYFYGVMARSSAIELLRLSLADAAQRIERTEHNLQMVIQVSNTAALAKAKALSHIIALDSEILKQPKKLASLLNELDIDELHISDEKGILIACVPQSYEGYNMAASEQSAEFLGALKDRNFTLVQPPRLNGMKQMLFQYAGVARLDFPGIVQIGYHPERVYEAMKIADVESISANFRIGKDGRLRIEKSQSVSHAGEQFFYEDISGTSYLCLSIPCGTYILTGSIPKSEVYAQRNSVLFILVITYILLFGGIFVLISWLLQRTVIRGIDSVNQSLHTITDGNLDETVEVRISPEFEILSDGINSTVSALKKSIENEAKRLNAELELGRKIQYSVLPANITENQYFCVAGGMFTAQEVGGDFYDFFMLDDSKLALLVADVSGKGITAALYMMNVKVKLKNLILSEVPEIAMEKANVIFCDNNKACMFVTAFLAILDFNSGKMLCVNAGHHPPILKRAEQKSEYLQINPSVALGVLPQAKYSVQAIQLYPHDRLILYTDGAIEAKNTELLQFGRERFRLTIDQCHTSSAKAVDEINNAIKQFAGPVPQEDDVTIVVLDYLKN